MIVGNFETRSCPSVPDHRCLSADCPGRLNPDVCRHLARLVVWRAMTTVEQHQTLEAARPAIDPAVRDAVNRCSSRGSVLPLSLQDDCDCRGQELSECRAGRGARPGRVTLRECLKCQGGQDLKPERDEVTSPARQAIPRRDP